MNYKSLFRNILKSTIEKKEVKYRIGEYDLELPSNFVLPFSQDNHKLYDQFLPVLAKFIDSDQVIIDVGANIGDTAFFILQNCRNPLICIEPFDLFFSFLQKNISKLPAAYSSRVKAYKHLVGSGLFSGELKHSYASAEFIVNTKQNTTDKFISLDEIVKDCISDIILLKVDTDGFDFDVIQSAQRVLKCEPILFWENDISEDFQNKGFKEMYSMLQRAGYNHLFVFDNFGNLMLKESDFKTIEDLNDYVFTQLEYNHPRTLYYTDVLATTDKHIACVRKAIDYYITNKISAG